MLLFPEFLKVAVETKTIVTAYDFSTSRAFPFTVFLRQEIVDAIISNIL
jgi:hypothetical protein